MTLRLYLIFVAALWTALIAGLWRWLDRNRQHPPRHHAPTTCRRPNLRVIPPLPALSDEDVHAAWAPIEELLKEDRPR